MRAYAQKIREALAKTEEERTAPQSRTQQNAPNLVTTKDMIKDPSRVRITVNFATNQADILPQYRAQLGELGKALQQMAGLSFEIGGHTDQRGPEDHNMRLSERRSESVRRYLIDRFGIASNRLIARGYGESALLDPRDTPRRPGIGTGGSKSCPWAAPRPNRSLPLIQVATRAKFPESSSRRTTGI